MAPPSAEQNRSASGHVTFKGTLTVSRLGVTAETLTAPGHSGTNRVRASNWPAGISRSWREIWPRPAVRINETGREAPVVQLRPVASARETMSSAVSTSEIRGGLAWSETFEMGGTNRTLSVLPPWNSTRGLLPRNSTVTEPGWLELMVERPAAWPARMTRGVGLRLLVPSKSVSRISAGAVETSPTRKASTEARSEPSASKSRCGL